MTIEEMLENLHKMAEKPMVNAAKPNIKKH